MFGQETIFPGTELAHKNSHIKNQGLANCQFFSAQLG
jgi:hypothetical protein